MSTKPQTDGGDEFVPDAGEDFTPEEQAAIERMQAETPMPTKNEGGDPPAAETQDGKPGPKQEADAGDGEAEVDLAEGEEEITIDGQGRERDKATGQFVSKSALLRTKEQYKATRSELERERAEKARIEGRLQVLTDIINTVPIPGEQKKDAAPANPWDEADVNPTEDLVGAFEQQKRRADYERKQREGLATGQKERDTHQEIVRTYVADAKRLAADQITKGEIVEVEGGQKVPAFQAAYLHLIGQRHAMLEALGVTDQAERDRRIASEEADLVQQAAQQKKSPAELIFAVAKAAGFRMPAKAQTNGKDAGKTPKQLEAERKIDQINKGMSATQSLSGKGGQAASGVTRAQIIAMDDAAFDAFTAKLSEEQLNKMLGAD